MGCCGHRTPGPTLSQVYAAEALVGVDGMVLIEYVGTNLGRQYWAGPVTGTRYMTKDTRRRIYVDARDAPGMLEWVVDHAQAFILVEVEEPVAEEPVAEEPSE